MSGKKISKYLVLLGVILSMIPQTGWGSESCNYQASVWSSKLKTTSRFISVKKDKKELKPFEKGPFDCTPCLEDQEYVQLSNGLKFRICTHIREKVKHALEKALMEGFVIQSIKGYRASYSRGPLNHHGERTLLSNHAYGTALDINENFNGLYTQCKTFGPHCKKTKGGPYNPQNSQAITKYSPLYQSLKKIGLFWGGERQDNLKDFMHFSPDGL